MQSNLAVTQPSPHHSIFKCQSFPSHFFTLHILDFPQTPFQFQSVSAFHWHWSTVWKPCSNVKMLSFFFCLRKYLLWREKTTKWCCIIQKGNSPPPKFRLYTVRQLPTTSQVDASIYFLLSSVSKFRNPICLREKSAVLLVNVYHCTEMQNKAEQMLHVPKPFNAQAHCK